MSASSTNYYVGNSVSNVYISPDLGAHSAFSNQQAVPDSAYDTLTEADTSTPSTDVEDFNDPKSGSTIMIGTCTHPSFAVLDLVCVSAAGVWARRLALDPEVDIPAPDTLEVEPGAVVTMHFNLRYEPDGTYVSNTEAVVKVNGIRAVCVAERERWEANVTSTITGSATYEIDTFQDPSGLTQISSTEHVPRIEGIPPIAPLDSPPLVLIVVGAIVAVVLVASMIFILARRRVEKLEHALTPEELLSIEDVTMPQEMRDQTIANLEWLKALPEEIPNMGSDVLSILWEELEKARTMYERAFEMETTAGTAGTELRKLLLERFDSVINVIDREIESRA